MIVLGIVIAGVMVTAFAVMVLSIRRCERHGSLFDPSQGGIADALTRKVLAVHVHQPQARTSRSTTAPSRTRSHAGTVR